MYDSKSMKAEEFICHEDHSTENQMQRFSRHFSEQKPCKDAASGTADEVGECIRDWKAVMQCINHD